MPAILVYSNVEKRKPNPVAEERFLMCPTLGVGYHTRPERGTLVPLPLGQIDFAASLTCPTIEPGKTYVHSGMAMHTYLPPDEFLLFIEMLAKLAGYTPIVADIPHLGKVNSHGLAVVEAMQDPHDRRTYLSPLAHLIASCSMGPVFHGAPLFDLGGELARIEKRVDNTILTRSTWVHGQLQKLQGACQAAHSSKGMLVIGR